MRRRLIRTLLALLLTGAAAAAGEDRLAVLEFFGRIGCGNCASAGQAITTLQRQFAGRAVLLEYSYDAFLVGRQDRFWATGVTAYYLPLVMVGSGYRTSSGSTAHEQVYRSMLNSELARPPRAAVMAWWRRQGSALRVYAEATNRGTTDWTAGGEAALWVIGYENARVGHTDTWVWTTVRWALPYDLAPGESVTAIIDTPPLSGPDWDRIAALVLAEDRPAPGGAYDMLQAAVAAPAGLTASPQRLVVGAAATAAELELAGPEVLSWTATSDAEWLEARPSAGAAPGPVTLKLRPRLRPAGEREATIRFDAAGDGMSFTTTVTVAVGPELRQAGRRLGPAG
jgi:hypothetical protein